MRICLFNVTTTMDAIGSGEVGGVEAYVFRLGRVLQARGHAVTLFGGEPRGARPAWPAGLDIRLFPHLPTSRIPDLGTRFRRLMQRFHFACKAHAAFMEQTWDAALIFKPYDFVTAWRWRRAGFRGRIIASIHGPEFYPCDRLLAGSVDAMYAVSASTAKGVEARYGRSCPVIPHFIEADRFPWVDRTLPTDEKLVITVGRLVGWKGLSVLIRAFAEVLRRVPSASLVMIGDGPCRPELEALVSDLGLTRAVRFAGILGEKEVIGFHRRASLLVQPSIGYESFSLSALEALASGVAVLASDQVGLAEWFRPGEGIEVYPSRDEHLLAENLCRLLTEPWAECRRRSRIARGVVERTFETAPVAARIESLCAGGTDRLSSTSS